MAWWYRQYAAQQTAPEREQVKAQDLAEGEGDLTLTVAIDVLALNLHVRNAELISFLGAA